MRLAYLSILAVAHSAYADDPFACVDPDVARAFLGDPYRERGEYSTAIPDDFIDLDLPAGFSLIGSQIFESTTTVIFKSNMGRDRALGSALDAMTGSGWAENEQRHWGVTSGFQTSNRPTAAEVLCNDDIDGALSIISSEKSGQTFISYAYRPTSQSCDTKESTQFRHNPSEMMRLLPRLMLPEDTMATNLGRGGTGHQAYSHVDVSGKVGRSDLASFFENQIRTQDWEFQTSWSSHHSSGSVWALDTVDDGLLIGTLHLFDSGADPIRVRFSATPADPTKGEDHGSWSGSSN